MKRGSEKPRVEFWINLGSNAKKPTANRLNPGLKNFFDRKYTGIMVNDEIEILLNYYVFFLSLFLWIAHSLQ